VSRRPNALAAQELEGAAPAELFQHSPHALFRPSIIAADERRRRALLQGRLEQSAPLRAGWPFATVTAADALAGELVSSAMRIGHTGIARQNTSWRRRMALKRMGVIGDIHAEHALLDSALATLRNRSVELVVATGDIADGKGWGDACCESASSSAWCRPHP
jgi:hypothetical protein